MYTKHFGLKKLPFENVPDPMFFFNQGDYARVRNRVTDSLKAGRGLIVVTGPIGSGKTTLSQMIKSDFSNDVRVIWMPEPPGNSSALFLFIAQELGLQPLTSERVFVLRDIKDALLKINSEGSKCLLIIDESHLIADNILNGIRLLNNLEEGSTKLIQILLLGQDELMGIISRPEMESFKQRIATLENLGKMNANRTRKYISYRIEVAGGHPSIFTDTGFEALVLASGTGGGVPRIINSLCDRSLNTAFEREKTKADIDDVSEAAEKMGIDKEVFHYKIALRSKERKKQVPSTTKNNAMKEPETLSKVPIPSLSRQSDGTDMENKNREPETSQSTQKENKNRKPETSQSTQKENKNREPETSQSTQKENKNREPETSQSTQKENKNREPETSQSTQNESKISFFIPKIEQKSLKIPLLFLLFSTVALILSIFFYMSKIRLP